MKYLLVIVLIYFIASRVFKISNSVKKDKRSKKPKDKHGGEYVDYEEIDE